MSGWGKNHGFYMDGVRGCVHALVRALCFNVSSHKYPYEAFVEKKKEEEKETLVQRQGCR